MKDIYEGLEDIVPSDAEIKEETRIKRRELNGWHENHDKAMALKSYDSKFKSKMSNVANTRDTNYYQNHQQGIDTREQNETYKIQRASKNRKQATDPNYLKKLKAGVSNRFLEQKGYIVCPNGIFKNQSEAAEAMGVAVSTIQRKLKINPSEYYYMSREEYIMLTGKE